MAKHDQKGRTRTELPHTRLYHTMTGSDAWLDLTGNAVKVYVALCRYNNGGNNGDIFLSARMAAEATGLTANTAAKALRELEAHGFIEAVERGHFAVKVKRATRWRITSAPVPSQSRPATNDWQRWSPAVSGNKPRSQNLMETVSIFEQPVGNEAVTVSNIDTDPTETSHVSEAATVSKNNTQIVCHRHGRERGSETRWKHANSASGVSTDLVGAELLDQLRGRIGRHLEAAGVGAQTRLAASAKVPGGTLSKFLAGKNLNRTHFVALQLAVANAARIAA